LCLQDLMLCADLVPAHKVFGEMFVTD